MGGILRAENFAKRRQDCLCHSRPQVSVDVTPPNWQPAVNAGNVDVQLLDELPLLVHSQILSRSLRCSTNIRALDVDASAAAAAAAVRLIGILFISLKTPDSLRVS